MLSFRHLGVKLTLLYSGLFAAAMLAIGVSVAFAPATALPWLFGAIALVGLATVAIGSWLLARSLTRPITALDEAARKLERGEEAHVEIASYAEIARLAERFNTMAGGMKERERRIRQLAMHDPESALQNRRSFEAAMALQARNATGMAIAAVGIDRFHHVRNAIGYQMAGEVVKTLGGRLKDICGAARVSRLSADTLGVILPAREDAALLALGANILRRIDVPVRIGHDAIDVIVTIGIARQTDAATPGDMITQASVAIDQARAANRRVGLFDAAAYGDPRRNLALMSELRAAMSNGDAYLAHQPKYDLRTGKISGVEALMRWRHPQRGMISPDIFITMAEDTGHVRRVTEWVLARAIAEQANMRAAGHDLPVSVNVSGRLLGETAFADKALAMIANAEASICFEITETAVIDNAALAFATIARCGEAGVGISIDDYGSGLSSLSYLKQIRAQELKIDKTFVLSAAESGRDALLIKSTIDLAHSLGMKVTAEGVETRQTLALLASMGCDVAQGYLIGKPMPMADIIAMLNAPAQKLPFAAGAMRA
ncbi:diguanylate cyclase/phosphodiesterase [alpha proteobacterium U9-1i]|nr:diguanylate cyclase/phosphodiesterase [alpha proteobacterium U9-1i]